MKGRSYFQKKSKKQSKINNKFDQWDLQDQLLSSERDPDAKRHLSCYFPRPMPPSSCCRLDGLTLRLCAATQAWTSLFFFSFSCWRSKNPWRSLVPHSELWKWLCILHPNGTRPIRPQPSRRLFFLYIFQTARCANVSVSGVLWTRISLELPHMLVFLCHHLLKCTVGTYYNGGSCFIMIDHKHIMLFDAFYYHK